MSRQLSAGTGPRTKRNLSMSAIDEGFAALFSKVEQATGLSPLEHAAAMGFDTWEVGSNSGTIAGFKGNKVDWVSKCSFTTENEGMRQCLRAWVMPMYDVPHLSVSLGQSPQGLTAELDLVAKDDLMYAKAYRENYYAGEVSDWWAALAANDQAVWSPISKNLKERTLASPVHVSVTLPDTEENAAVLVDAASALTDRWLGYLEEATEIPRVRRGTMLLRDSELRRMYWAVASTDPALGDRGPEIAAAMAGPGDVGYTGQAS